MEIHFLNHKWDNHWNSNGYMYLRVLSMGVINGYNHGIKTSISWEMGTL